jgi:hypothetical protein
MVGVGSTIVGASFGVSAGGIGVFVGNGIGVCEAVGGTSVGGSVSVLVGIGVRVGIDVLVCVGVGVMLFSAKDAAVLGPPTEGFVPQSIGVLRHLVTSVCKAAGSHALKKS